MTGVQTCALPILTGRRGQDTEISTLDWVDLAASFSVHLAPNQPAFEQQVLIPHDFEFHPVETK